MWCIMQHPGLVPFQAAPFFLVMVNVQVVFCWIVGFMLAKFASGVPNRIIVINSKICCILIFMFIFLSFSYAIKWKKVENDRIANVFCQSFIGFTLLIFFIILRKIKTDLIIAVNAFFCPRELTINGGIV